MNEIKGDTIIFKSNPEVFWKEKQGLKPNTCRFLTRIKEIEQVVNFHAEFAENVIGVKKIEIINADNTNQAFMRVLTDIIQYPERWLYIFSWRHEE